MVRLINPKVKENFTEISASACEGCLRTVQMQNGGEGGIRTHGTVSRTFAFEASAFNRSATSPRSFRHLLYRERGTAATRRNISRFKRITLSGASVARQRTTAAMQQILPRESRA